MRAADLLDQFRHGRVFGQRLSEHGEQPVPVAGDPLALDVEIQPAQELAVRSRVHDERTAHLDRLRQRVVGVAAENHVEPVHPPGQLEVDGQTVVREQHDQVDVLVVSQLVDERLDSVLADAEGEVGHEAPGMGHRRVRERLADDSHTDTANLSDRVRVEDAIAPACDRDVVRDEVAGEESPPLAVAEELAHPLEAVDELPVRREDVDPELVGDAHHVLTAAPEGGRRTLEGVAAVEDQRTAGPLRADPLHQRRQVRVAAHPPVARGQRREVQVRVGVGLDRAGSDVIGA